MLNREISKLISRSKAGRPTHHNRGVWEYNTGRLEDETDPSGTGRQKERKAIMWRRQEVIAHKPQNMRTHVPWLNFQTEAATKASFFREYEDKEIGQVVHKLSEFRSTCASNYNSVGRQRIQRPFSNKGLGPINTAKSGNGISNISMSAPARKTMNINVDSFKHFSTDENDPANSDQLADVFQAPGEELQGSTIPFDVRFGFNCYGTQPFRYGNIEMAKNPHFLHLTPIAIKRHCKELKEFMTPFPKNILSKNSRFVEFPLVVKSSDYIGTRSDMADPRSQKVEMRVPLSILNLSVKAKIKLIDMIQSHENRSRQSLYVRWQTRQKPRGVAYAMLVRYDPVDQVIVISSNDLPLRNQNRDYVIGLLERLVLTAKNNYKWEENLVFSDKFHSVHDKKHLEELNIAKRENYEKMGFDVSKIKNKELAKMDNWMFLNSINPNSQNKNTEMSDKLKRYQEYGKQNMQALGLSDKKLTDDGKRTTFKNNNVPFIYQPRTKGAGKSGSYHTKSRVYIGAL